jgi:hypothetical protein
MNAVDGMHEPTPGPWKVGQPKHDPQAYDVVTATGGQIARLPWRNRANAALMAAAPEMFEALGLLLDELDKGAAYSGSPTRCIERARAAIAKARNTKFEVVS